MSRLALTVGGLLIGVGIAGFAASHLTAPTALIPALLGVLLGGAGALARRPGLRMHAMHGALTVALVGLLACLRGVVHLPALLTGGEVARPLAVISQSVTALLCAIFLVLGVRSFIEARRARGTEAGNASR